ncbi:MAG: radical SAM protein [Chloroflexi bacterium]|nr:radical SAM protein [Chloroflexota bacterium]
MSDTTVTLTLKKNKTTAKVEGTRVVFSPHQCFAFDNGDEDIECLNALAAHLKNCPGLVFIGSKKFINYFLQLMPDIGSYLVGVMPYDNPGECNNERGLASVALDMGLLPTTTQTVFICDTLTFPRVQIKQRLPMSINVIEPTILAEISPEIIPARGWTPLQRNIYPIAIPEIEFKTGLDFAIVDAPSRNLSLMPNGLAYLNNALKKTSVSFQILDLDIISYHRFHVHRLYDMGGHIVLPGDLALPEDPWQAEHYDLWTAAGGGATGVTGRNEVLEFFRPLIDETIEALVQARPKVLGLSIQGCNEAAAREVAIGVKARLPDIIIIVGGFSCYNADIGRRAFPECDYMCIGEADLTVGPLLDALARGDRPFNQPGVLSRFDTPEFKYLPAPMIHDLDKIEFPKYEWCDLKVYRNFNDYQLTPIIASRGCRWSRCTFCAERFYWRIRTPENFVDELEWLVNQGCHLFMFNESDLGGMPERVEEICDEIIRRGLHRKVKLTGQLRVNKNQTRSFFEKLREANFVALRFGIDAFSENTLRLQKKGYTVEMISQNLKDCWEVGIYTEINWVIGVPGETDKDVEEGVDLILKNSKYIGRLANINPLILVNGSVYWIDPEAHNIVFKEPKEQIYEKYPRALPADQWHSTDPYIDAHVRKERFEQIVIALYESGFNVGAWANRIIEDVKFSRDKARTGGVDGENNASFGEFEVAGGEKITHTPDITEEEQAIDMGSHRSPLEEKSRLGEAVSTQTLDSKIEQATKPAAAPPLFGIVGEPPQLIRKTDTHNVIFHNGWYYGVPHVLADIDLTNPETAGRPGIIRFTTEEEVIVSIEESAEWANSRGQYDDQKKQRASGSYMRVDSVGEISGMSTLPAKPRILKFGENYLAVDQQTLTDAFTTRRFAPRISGKDSVTTSDGSRPIDASTFIRRMVSLLSPLVVDKIRGLIRQQSYSNGIATSPLATKSDGQLAGMLVRALGDAYIRRPLIELRNSITGSDELSITLDGVKVEGESFSIVSVVTKNAQPELMWTIGAFNLVKFDGIYYGVPHGASVDWESSTIEAIPGMLVGPNVTDLIAIIDSLTTVPIQETVTVGSSTSVVAEQHSKEPVLLGTMESNGYNIVSYEGWVYGMPYSLGPIDLTQVDVIEMPGVIRDVSRDAVESEVISRSNEKRQVA